MTHKSRISTVLDGIVRRSRRAAQEAAQKRRRVEVDRAENIVQSIVRREAARSAEAIRCRTRLRCAGGTRGRAWRMVHADPHLAISEAERPL